MSIELRVRIRALLSAPVYKTKPFSELDPAENRPCEWIVTGPGANSAIFSSCEVLALRCTVTSYLVRYLASRTSGISPRCPRIEDIITDLLEPVRTKPPASLKRDWG